MKETGKLFFQLNGSISEKKIFTILAPAAFAPTWNPNSFKTLLLPVFCSEFLSGSVALLIVLKFTKWKLTNLKCVVEQKLPF